MAKNHLRAKSTSTISAQPRLHQRAGEIQAYGTVSHLLPLELEEPVRPEMTERLNQQLADTITLPDLYGKSHCEAAGHSFHQHHVLLDKHLGQPALVQRNTWEQSVLAEARWRSSKPAGYFNETRPR